MRIVITGLAIVLIIFSCGLALRANQQSTFAQGELNKERYLRLTAEEQLQRSTQEIAALSADLKKVQDRAENAEQALERIKSINDDLKQRLDKAAEVQASLDKRIEELQGQSSAL